MTYTILIADDNDDMRVVLGHQLQSRGYRVIMVSDGLQVLEKARGEKPDLILLDILMPGLDGTEASVQLKSDPVTQKIPIIFLTSLIQGGDGDTSVMAKATDINVLVSKIQKTLEQK